MTKELQAEEEESQGGSKKAGQNLNGVKNWRPGQKCMALWRADGKHYPGTLDQVLDDGTCTVIFDDKFNNEISLVSQLLPYDPDKIPKKGISNNKSASQIGSKKAFTK